ncbi:MAG: glycerate kinase type-2 family protein [Thermoplasmata archaeon]
MNINILEENKLIIPLIDSAIEAAKPEKYMKNILVKNNILYFNDIEISFKNNYLIAIGKAAISMVKSLRPFNFKKKIIISNEKDPLDEVIISSHPLSNENGYLGALEIMKLISETDENDLIVLLLSGGASSMLADYRIPIEIANSLFSDLMKAGANIFELNMVRKHLSFLKGGRFAKSTKSKILTLIISDVLGDDLSTIGSGPTYFDNSTFKDAIEVMKKFHLENKYSKILKMFTDPENFSITETVKDKEFPKDRVWNKIICNNEKALKAAETEGIRFGFNVINLGTIVSGEAKLVSGELYSKFSSLDKKSILISGGETVVTVNGGGKGGRNQELVLSLVNEIKENEVIASFGTDGIDGVTDAAGAVADYSTRKRSSIEEINEYLRNNDSYNFFKKMGTLIMTGPTGTNVMDVQILIKR